MREKGGKGRGKFETQSNFCSCRALLQAFSEREDRTTSECNTWVTYFRVWGAIENFERQVIGAFASQAWQPSNHIGMRVPYLGSFTPCGRKLNPKIGVIYPRPTLLYFRLRHMSWKKPLYRVHSPR